MLSRIGLFLGPLLLAGWFLLADPGPLPPPAHRLAGVMLLTICWWVTEPIPLPATGLFAIVLCVLLGAVPDDGKGAAAVLSAFAEPSVFFMLGGLFLGHAMFKHGLDRRLALALLCTRRAGRSPGTVLAAIGLGVMLISMWISNTAATAMMYPVTLGIIAVLAASRSDTGFSHSPYATALLLMTAFASSVGGIATPIGTVTNVVALGYFRRPEYFGQNVDFLRWSLLGVPLMLLIFVSLYAWLRVRAPAGGLDMARLGDYFHDEYARLGRWTTGELHTLAVFVFVVGLWLTPGVLALAGATEAGRAFARRCPEEVAALLTPVLLFLLPVNWGQGKFALESADLRQVDWGIILMFGSGLALGGLMDRTGLARVVGRGVFELLGTHDVWVVTAVAVGAGLLLSEFMGNAAALSTLLPVIHAACLEADVERLWPLFGVTLAASFGSALPVSTPPNAIVYSSGLIPVGRMIVMGVGLDLICAAAIWVVLRVAAALAWTPFATSG